MKFENITIIGGSGALGSWFGRWFTNHNFNVTLYGRNKDRLTKAGTISGAKITQDFEESVKDADVIMVSVPIHDTPEILKQISHFSKPNSLIFDVASVKQPIIEEMETLVKEDRNDYVSIHPMFGPGADGLKGKKIIFIDFTEGRSKKASKKLENILSMDKADLPTIIHTTANEHDKMISLTLGLPHTLSIVFMEILSNSGIPLKDISQFGGTTFKIQKILSESVIRENPNIYSQIQMKNPIFINLLKELPRIFEDYYKMINQQNYQEFEEKFSSINRHASDDEDYKDAYKKFYKFYNSLKPSF